MVIGLAVSIALFGVCGLIALAFVKVVNYLDRTTSIGEKFEAVAPSHDANDQGLLQDLAADEETTITVALAGANASNELDTLPGRIEGPDTEQPIASELDSGSHAVNEGESRLIRTDPLG